MKRLKLLVQVAQNHWQMILAAWCRDVLWFIEASEWSRSVNACLCSVRMVQLNKQHPTWWILPQRSKLKHSLLHIVKMSPGHHITLIILIQLLLLLALLTCLQCKHLTMLHCQHSIFSKPLSTLGIAANFLLISKCQSLSHNQCYYAYAHLVLHDAHKI